MSSQILCLCGPGGSGKSSLATKLCEENSGCSLSISTTTRECRKGETNGVNYHFVSESEFKRRIEEDSFLEHAVVAGHRYGTEKNALEVPGIVVLDIDWQGAEVVKRLYPSRATCCLVLPPTVAELRNRLERRGRDSEEVIKTRLSMAEREVKELLRFCDYFIENDSFEAALEDVKSVLRAGSCRSALKNAEQFFAS